jgi:hypothetical protein
LRERRGAQARLVGVAPAPRGRDSGTKAARTPPRSGKGMPPEGSRFEPEEDIAQLMKGHGPCSYLLLALIALILLYPYLQHGLFSRIVLAILYTAVLLGGAYAMGQNKSSLILSIGLAVTGVAMQWLSLLVLDVTMLRITAVIYAVFLVLMIGEVLRYILKRGPVTADKLHAAIAGYIMIAFVWAFVFTLIESFSPGSFAPQQAKLCEPAAFFHLLYFSFTALTTTGFGDITPVTDQARSLVMIEEFAGVFFVGVLIARLAGLYPQEER